MRLTNDQVMAIKSAVSRHFGESAKVWLFGPRVDDQARGGDIDLYIETEMEQGVLEAELKARVELLKQHGDRKIDLVIRRVGQAPTAIHGIAKETGILL